MVKVKKCTFGDSSLLSKDCKSQSREWCVLGRFDYASAASSKSSSYLYSKR